MQRFGRKSLISKLGGYGSLSSLNRKILPDKFCLFLTDNKSRILFLRLSGTFLLLQNYFAGIYRGPIRFERIIFAQQRIRGIKNIHYLIYFLNLKNLIIKLMLRYSKKKGESIESRGIGKLNVSSSKKVTLSVISRLGRKF